MKRSWEFPSKDGRSISVRDATARDARDMHTTFCDVVWEGRWLPTLQPNSTVADWVTWIEGARRRGDVILKAEVEGQHAGHLTLQPEEWAASRHVAKLGIIVRMDYRNIGVGRSLMLAAERAAPEAGYEKIVLSTFADNSAAQHLYSSLGYRTVGTRFNHFKMEKGFIHEVLYEKELSHPIP
ncbi:MAG: GNAT family N-acetyltransferase [Candidatus Thorarchaeota archaeon]|nr:GNAT family N-acetyltransferase [Candidatus Thorarchaeota archaeon]